MILICTLVFVLAIPPHKLAFVPAYAFGIAGIDGPIDSWAAARGLVGHLWIHSDIFHLLTNMAALAIFGPGVNQALGGRRHVALFVIAGIAGALIEGATTTDRLMPMLGASGGISGIMAARVALYPSSRLVVLMFQRVVLSIPLLALVSCDVSTNVVMATISATDFAAFDIASVAWGAHLGGFAAGLILTTLIRPTGTEWLSWRGPAPEQRLGFGILRGRPVLNGITVVVWLAIAAACWRGGG